MANEVTVKVEVTGTAEAIAKLNLLGRAAQDQTDKTNTATTGWGRFNQAIGNVLKNIPLVGNSLSGMGAAGIPVLGAIISAVIALIGFISEIVGSLVAAGAGFVAFGALAYPAISKIISGVNAVSGAATQAAKNKAWAAIPDALKPAVHTILDIKDAWTKMSDSMLPLVGRIANTLGDIVKKLLPLMKPLADTAGKAIEGILKQLDRAAGSKGFRDFMAQLTSVSGPSLTALGKGLLQLGGAIGTFLKDISGSGQGPSDITALFTILSGAIRVLGAELQVDQGYLRVLEIFFADLAHAGIVAAKTIGDGFLNMASTILKAMSHIPGLGFLKQWSAQVQSWQSGFDVTMNKAISSVEQWRQTVVNAPHVAKLEANITDLQSKLATARALLNNPDLTKARRAQIEANIANLQREIAIANNLLNQLNGKTATTYVNTVYTKSGPSLSPGQAQGGITGAAAGGPRSNLTMVGEHGRELVKLAPGSRVFSNPDTERILAGHGAGKDGGRVTVEFDFRGAENDFIKFIRNAIWVRGGNVQKVLGRS